MYSGRRVFLLLVLILVTWASVSVGSEQFDFSSGYSWQDQYTLNLSLHHQNELISADGVSKAKMYVELRDKKTTNLAGAPSNIVVYLTSDYNITIEPSTVVIPNGTAKSEDISLTSIRPGIACVKAEAIGFGGATIFVEFVPSPPPDELLLVARPEIIRANGRDPTNLIVELLDPAGEPIKLPQDTIIDIWTSTGKSFGLTLPAEKYYGRAQLTTDKYGVITVTAESFDFWLNDSTTVATDIPSKLQLEAIPKENISANGRNSVKLTVRLRKSNDDLFYPPQNTTIILSTSTGKSFDLILPEEMPTGTAQFTTDDYGVITDEYGVIYVTAKSLDFDLSNSTTVTTLIASKLVLEATPPKILANDWDQCNLTVKLLRPDGNLFYPPQNTTIILWTNTGKSYDLILSEETPIGTQPITEYRSGVITVTAGSPFWKLNESTTVSFVPVVNPLTGLSSGAGGFLATLLLLLLYLLWGSHKQEHG
jgi:hypothetical protein